MASLMTGVLLPLTAAVRTEMSRADVLAALQALAGETWILPSGRRVGVVPISGDRSGNRFELIEPIAYRNSFKTTLTAKVVGRDAGADLQCVSSMNPLVVLFCFAFLVVACVVLFAMLTAQIRQHHLLSPWQLVPAGMLLLASTLLLSGRAAVFEVHEDFVEFLRVEMRGQLVTWAVP